MRLEIATNNITYVKQKTLKSNTHTHYMKKNAFEVELTTIFFHKDT